MGFKKYFIKTPWWLKRVYPSYQWDVATKEKKIYFTFDDGPHPVATPFVLDQLAKHEAKATFFCIGKNVMENTAIYQRILDEGHSAGNHTQHHLNGWKTSDRQYLADIAEASKYIDSTLFRPPYGRIGSFQAKQVPIILRNASAKVVMWDVLSGDFDETITGEECLQHVILNAKAGSIVVFHDSAKAWDRLEYCLPRALEFFKKNGFLFERLENLSVKEIQEEK